jgi:hypothetical protein
MNKVDAGAEDDPRFAVTYLDTIDALCHNSHDGPPARYASET